MSMFQDWVKQTDTRELSDGCRSIEEGEIAFSPKNSSFESHLASHDDTATTAAVMEAARNNNDRSRWTTSMSNPAMFETPFFDSPRQRKRVLWISVALLVVVVVIAISVPVATSLSKKNASSSSSSASSSVNDVAEDGFDFTGVNATGKAPTNSPIAVGTTLPPVPTVTPSFVPSDIPSMAPTSSHSPSSFPTSSPTVTYTPTSMPSSTPTSSPTTPIPPVAAPPILPVNTTSDTLLTFCVIADVPYDEKELTALPDQIETQMEGCEFLVHLGDLFIGDTNCDEQSYYDIRDVMMMSKVPTFVVVGDNEWNDCVKARIDAGWQLWNQEFLRFENNWNHTITVVRQPGFEENFYFVEKRTLIIGLNLVGGRVHNSTEWKARQGAEYEWTRNVINLFVPTFADGVIILAHAKPTADHRFFMDPLKHDMANNWKNTFPILYLHGDGHSWVYSPHFKSQPNMLRVQHEGGVRDPILKILADPAKNGPEVYSAFQFDRQLELA
jgi:Calcineurin-like phosphoesterase